MYRVRQRFDATAIAHVDQEIRNGFAGSDIASRVKPGQSVAVAVGSRGIDQLATIVSATIGCLRDLGLKPFIMPAMGSHGGASAEGQTAILHELGIKEKTMGAPVVSHMDVVVLDRLPSGAEVFFAQDALAADHLFVINRIKPHTAFRSEIESGLCKMLAVGCGKHQGASTMHRFGLGDSVVPAAQRIIARTNVLGGLALLENSLDRILDIRLTLPEGFVAVDRELIALARDLLPRIPIDSLDILVIEQIGKNISGAGVDPNVVGFWRREGGDRRPDYRILVALELTPESHGNAVGMGVLDLVSKRLIDAVDFDATYTNVLTSGIWAAGRMPIALETDRAVLDAALAMVTDIKRLRMARIRNTLQLETFWVTEALIDEVHGSGNMEVDPRPLPIAFDQQGRLLPFDI
jgi:hypothetical protein